MISYSSAQQQEQERQPVKWLQQIANSDKSVIPHMTTKIKAIYFWSSYE